MKSYEPAIDRWSRYMNPTGTTRQPA